MLKRWIKCLLCRHRWQIQLVFCNSPKTHADVMHCLKCGKDKIVFKGTRKDWLEHHNFKE